MARALGTYYNNEAPKTRKKKVPRSPLVPGKKKRQALFALAAYTEWNQRAEAINKAQAEASLTKAVDHQCSPSGGHVAQLHWASRIQEYARTISVSYQQTQYRTGGCTRVYFRRLCGEPLSVIKVRKRKGKNQ
jgi:hypothetical protein